MVIYVGSPSEFRRIIEVAPSVAEKVRQTVEWRASAKRGLSTQMAVMAHP